VEKIAFATSVHVLIEEASKAIRSSKTICGGVGLIGLWAQAAITSHRISDPGERMATHSITSRRICTSTPPPSTTNCVSDLKSSQSIQPLAISPTQNRYNDTSCDAIWGVARPTAPHILAWMPSDTMRTKTEASLPIMLALSFHLNLRDQSLSVVHPLIPSILDHNG
jgi:hypothetical protein